MWGIDGRKAEGKGSIENRVKSNLKKSYRKLRSRVEGREESIKFDCLLITVSGQNPTEFNST